MANEYKIIIAEKKREASRLMTDKQLTECNVAIHTAATAAAASGAIPIPGVDAVPISTAQVAMVMALGKIFDQKMTESAAKGILSATVSTFVGRSLVKLIPVAGWVVSAAVAASVTEAVGWGIAIDFAKMSKRVNIENDKDDDVEHDVTNAEATEDQVVNEPQDDESMANDFVRAFGEEEE